MEKLRLLGTLVFGVLALSAAISGSAFANPPTIERIPVDETFITSYSDVCGFPITRHNVGSMTFIVRYDANGNPVREVDQIHVANTFSANGQTLSGRFIVNYNVVYNPDGSLEIQDMGQNILVAPGQGPIAFLVGMERVELDTDGNVTFFEAHGQNYGLEGFCAALAP